MPLDTLQWGGKMKLFWSANYNAFFPEDMIDSYQSAGWKLDGIIEATQEMLQYYGTPPADKVRGVDDNGMPVWIDVPQPSNAEKKKQELLDLSSKYKADILELNAAWLAAAVNDGENEISKKNMVISEIAERKSKYASERADIVSKYK